MTLFGECGYDCWERGRDCDHADRPGDDGPGLDWDDGPDEPPPGRRVKTIETTGDRL